MYGFGPRKWLFGIRSTIIVNNSEEILAEEGVNVTVIHAFHQLLHAYSLFSAPLPSLSVDVLEEVGLSESNQTSDDSFFISKPLSSPTSGSEWTALSSDFPHEFSVYVEFNASQYNGRVISINRNTTNEFSLSVESTNGGSVLHLTLLFPGISSVTVDLFPADSNGFQTIGVALQQSQVLVYHNCIFGGFVKLPEVPGELDVSQASLMQSEVEIFEQPASVRV